MDPQDHHWRHGDIKPDNILRFTGSFSSDCHPTILGIEDLGLSKWDHEFSAQETTNEIYSVDSTRGGAQETFDYTPLGPPNAFRVLTLLPGPSSERLNCTINNQILNDGTSYEALSYVWGKETDCANILCDGKEMDVPRNLSDFLFQLRHPTKARAFWADAICINQKDEKEKGPQIRLMRSIFRQATKVLVWIGTARSEVARLAFNFAQEVFRSRKHHDLQQTPEKWQAISNLFCQDWFWRKWCFQEIVLAREAEFRWGSAVISWEHLGYAAAWIQERGYEILSKLPFAAVHHATVAYSLGRFGTVSGGSNAPENKITFLHLMMVTRNFEASKAHDRIFALLGIPTADVDRDNGAVFMDPDYDISKEDLYRDFAKRCIESSKNLNVLSAVYHGSHMVQNDTWVPQWDLLKPRSIIPTMLGAKQFSASSHLEENRASINGTQLIVVGQEVDTIEKTSQEISDIQTLRRDLSPIRKIWDIVIASLSDPLPDGTTLAKSFCWTISAGNDWKGALVEREQEHLDDFAAFMDQEFEFSDFSEATCDGNKNHGIASRFMEAMFPMICERQIFITSKGYLGLGPACLEEGDLVCTLAGATVPFILRRGDSGQYALVGESYVHGIMYRDAKESSTEDGPLVQEFTIL